MTRHAVLASVIYRCGVSLKTMRFSALRQRQTREKVGKTVSCMQFLTHCLGMPHISDAEAATILSVLTSVYAYDMDADTAAFWAQPSGEAVYSQQHHDLLVQMDGILCTCLRELTERSKGYTERIMRCLFAFHNLPRAFLSPSDRWHLSADAAKAMAASWLGKDANT